MKKIILKITVLGVLFLFMGACSKKTATQDSDSNRPSKEQRRQPRGERPQFSDLLSEMDGNKDGKLSKAEVKGPLQNNFSEIDKDNDGFISETEFESAPPPPRRGGKRN
ncbi:MAG: EF-hand domain-containing protein [Bacteroidota bacterium]